VGKTGAPARRGENRGDGAVAGCGAPRWRCACASWPAAGRPGRAARLFGDGFVQRCPCTIEGDHTEVRNGVLSSSISTCTISGRLTFRSRAEQVCLFSLIYHDINANNTMTARLVRKSFALGETRSAAADHGHGQ